MLLHTLHLTWNVVEMGSDLSYWVKLQSSTRFAVFLLTKYDNEPWIQNFRITKDMLLSFI